MKYFFLHLLLLTSALCFAQVNFTSSNLPIVVLETNGQTIADDPKITATIKIIYNGPGKRNQVTDTQINYKGSIGIELRGNSSQSFDQKQYGFETRDAAGNNLDTSLLGMPKEKDWVLYAPWNDISMIRNVLGYHLWNKMDHWGPRTRMVEVLLNGNYQGVYVLTESIKRGDNRVQTASLKAKDISGIDLTGGYIMKIDAKNSDEDKSFNSTVPGIVSGSGGFGGTPSTTVTWLYHYPEPKNIQPAQEEYIRKYIDTVETLIQSPNFNDPVNGYEKYISLQSFLDYLIHTEVSLNSDGLKRSAFFYKEKMDKDGSKGKLKAGPVWDLNLAYGNCNFCKGNQVTAWVHKGCETLPVPAMWGRLLQDPKFANELKCRYLELRQGILSDAYIHSFINAYADTLKEAQARHFSKWTKLLQTSSGGGGGFPGFPGGDLWFSAYRVSSYAAEIDTLKKWFTARLKFLDNNLPGTCVITSTAQKAQFNNLQVLPNPADDMLIIEAEERINTVQLFSSIGQLIIDKPITGNERRLTLPEIESCSPGIYSLIIYGDDGKIGRQLIMVK
ncbi:CotH kinase family protein [Sporocytophaga myxococcoides]|uniref:CotH kinase family protein n=1 Tax=Sporocytophaga myxococcoides TaxID=153721 RepID=UPI00042942A7|nr:CotH kinase family protein [Sporocytophaga myxococcoides]